ncbi:MAG: hypothetical protein R2798_12040 [Chitinophagales bacterium]|nr:hypothetical protein [Bacteroidota bacterium]MCB9043633.1 hypothetical protein [Chitinophagales bacterium]
MYNTPIIDWSGMVEYLSPLLFRIEEFNFLEIKSSTAILHFEYCNLLFHYEVQDRFLSAYILDLTGIINAEHMIQLTPTFDYFLNGNFKKYVETLHKNNYKYYYTSNQYIIFDYLITILNSDGLVNYINNGLKIDEYLYWLKKKGEAINKELLKLYNNNC